MTPTVIQVRFAPIEVVTVGDWKIRLTHTPDSPGDTLRGEFVGEPPDETRYSWEYHFDAGAVVVLPHPKGKAVGQPHGFPDDALRQPLWKLIQKHTQKGLSHDA